MSVALEVHQQALAARRTLRTSEHTLAKILARVQAEKLHRDLGYASVMDYAVHALDLTTSKADGLLRLGRSLSGLPILDRAWAAGEIAWTKAREMLRILTPDNEAAWVERANTVTSRQLEADVDATLMGGEPPSAVEASKAPARKRITFTVDTADAEVIRTVLQWARAQLGEDRDEVDDGELLAGLLQRVMHDVPNETAPTAERYRVVVQRCPECGRTDAPECELTDAQVGEACCDAEVVELRAGPHRGHLTHAIPPAVRRIVLHRDGYACRVPGCTNRLYLDLHHVEHRARGGRHTEGNLVTVCTVHHGLAHDGRLGVERSGEGFLFTFSSGRTAWTPLERPRADGRLHVEATV
jgi:5-methylcytosine-specific restriction endonuclease McrA